MRSENLNSGSSSVSGEKGSNVLCCGDRNERLVPECIDEVKENEEPGIMPSLGT